MRSLLRIWIVGLVALLAACRGDRVGIERSPLERGDLFGGDIYGGTVDAGIAEDGGIVVAPDASQPAFDGGPIWADAGWSYPPDGGVLYPPDASPPYPPDGGVLYPPDASPPYPPDGGVLYPPDASPPYPPDGGVLYPPDAPPPTDAGPPDAPEPFCTTSDPAPACQGTCACAAGPAEAFGSCVVATTGDAPEPTGPLAIPDDVPRSCDAPDRFDTLVCSNGPSWQPPPLVLAPPDDTHYDVHHDHNHSAHPDEGSVLLGEGAEHDVCAWCSADPLDGRFVGRARPAAEGCDPLPAPTSAEAAARTLQCLWDQGKGWEDAKAAFPADVARGATSNLHLARKKIVDDLIALMEPRHKVATNISGTVGAGSDIDVSVQYKELCAESDVAAAIKLANAEFAKKVAKYPMTLGRALDVNFYFAREIPVRGMEAVPREIVDSESTGTNPEKIERLHEVAAMTKAREYMTGTSWTAFKARFDPLTNKTRAYQNDQIIKVAEGYYTEATGKLATQFKQAVRDRTRSGAPYTAATDAADLKVAAKITLYEGALADLQKVRNQRLVTVAAIRAGRPPDPALVRRLADETYQYEELVVKSSLFADQAYYARGSLLTVVARKKSEGGQGANEAAGVAEPVITTAHVFHSTIEQAGDLFKDLGHASQHDWKIGKTGIKASKYADRFFDGALATLSAIRGELRADEQANLDRLVTTLRAARAVNAELLTVRRSNAAYNDAQEAAAALKLKDLGIRDLGDFRSKYREWCTKVIVFKRLSEKRDR